MRKISAGLTLALVTLALAGCDSTSESQPSAETAAPQASPSAAPTASPTPSPSAAATSAPETPGPETCANPAGLVSYTDDWYVELEGSLKDLGAREFAAGEVTVDAEGNALTYTVAPGDVDAVIGERLCAAFSLAPMNHVRELEPGQVLWLNPDPETPWLSYFSPIGAPAGFDQISYQRAMDSARIAVDEGDLEALHAVWVNELSSMISIPEQVDAIQKVLDGGDPDALRQLFS